MIETLQIKQMTRVEQLQTMEVLWRELSVNSKSVESPLWHKELLKATETRYRNGQEKPLDWNIAKRELRDIRKENIKRFP